MVFLPPIRVAPRELPSGTSTTALSLPTVSWSRSREGQVTMVEPSPFWTRSQMWRVAGRAGWGVADQSLSSATNLLLNILMARLLSPEGFGAFALLYTTYLLLIGMLRAYLIDPFAVRDRSLGDDESLALGRVLGGGLAASFLLMVPMAVLIVLTPLELGSKLAFLVVLPFLPAQELMRSSLIAAQRARTAFLTDAVWAVVQAASLAAVFVLGEITAGWVLLTWGAGGAAGTAIGFLFIRVRPVLEDVTGYIRSSAQFGIPWVMDSMLGNGVSQTMAWVIGIVAGLAEVGAYRGALVLLGPSTVLIGGIRLVALPEIAKLRQTRPDQLYRTAVVTATAFILLVMAVTLPLLFLPESLGRQLLGESWVGASAVLPWAIVLRTIASAADGPLLALRAVPDRRATLQIRGVASVGSLLAGAGGALFAGAVGGTVGLAIGAGIALPVWFARLRSMNL
jgi:O-antigen/teichoic acid export membrane protein